MLILLVMLAGFAVQNFDHNYTRYAEVLRLYAGPPGVDYAALKANRSGLDAAIRELNDVAAAEKTWTREQRLAFWINAYNMLTLRSVIDHYPIRASWFTLAPRNSIRQIDGVWTTMRWRVAGQSVTLDDIEHRIIRPLFEEPRIHFALNCASVSCPALAMRPYLAAELETQLDEGTRRYLATPEGVVLTATTLRVSSLFKWYGDDFIARFASEAGGTRPKQERAILGLLSRYAPPPIAQQARSFGGPIRFLDYDWSLNDSRR